MKTFKALLSLFCLALMLCTNANANPFLPYNFSVWTDYKKMDFENLSQDEKTVKLQNLFIDKVQFCENHGIRRVLVRVLDPALFTFFNPETFDSARDDNFYYWAIELSKCTEVEVVFDPSPFNLTPSSWGGTLFNLAKTFFKVESTYKDFHNLAEKLTWVSIVNDMFDPTYLQGALIKGITVNPTGIDDQLFQLVINAIDQYRYNASNEFPTNNFPNIRTAACFNLDQKDLAFANLARFPLNTDLRSERKDEIGIKLTEAFPAQGEELLAPEWRPNDNSPLLNHIYLIMADRRLIQDIYQNPTYFPKPHLYDERGVSIASRHLSMNLRGEPIAKGPGKVTILKGTTDVKGLYTFFKTGSINKRDGLFVKNGVIEIHPPFTEKVMRKVISEDPDTNKHMKVTSSFSTTTDIVEADYYFNPTPISWNRPMISNVLASKIYFVFSCEFTPPKDLFMGNWGHENFIAFLNNQYQNDGFLYQPLFTNLLNQGQKPTNNIVIYDFTTIPNGTPYPEVNWGLRNRVHR